VHGISKSLPPTTISLQQAILDGIMANCCRIVLAGEVFCLLSSISDTSLSLFYSFFSLWQTNTCNRKRYGFYSIKFDYDLEVIDMVSNEVLTWGKACQT
jgi:hypothetical protein